MTTISREQVERLLTAAATEVAAVPLERSLPAVSNALDGLLHASGADASGRGAKAWLAAAGLRTLGDVDVFLAGVAAVGRLLALRALLDELDDVDSRP